MAFLKLDVGILDSSIWIETSDTRICWLTLLAMSNLDGVVEASVLGVARRACISLEATEKAIEIFMQPDRFSKNPNYEGRRLERFDNGFRILNYQFYRQKDHGSLERVRRFREKRKAEALQQLDPLPSAAIKGKKKISSLAVFEKFWAAFPKRVGKGAAEKVWQALKPDAELVEKILRALEWQRQQDQWTRDAGQFIPNPSTWLNQRRWEDEPRPVIIGGSTGRSSRPFSSLHAGTHHPERDQEPPELPKTPEQERQDQIEDLKKRIANAETFLTKPAATIQEKEMVTKNLAGLHEELAQIEGQVQEEAIESTAEASK